MPDQTGQQQGTAGTAGAAGGTGGGAAQGQQLSLVDMLANKDVQSEIDRRVTQALKTLEARMKAERDEAIEKTQREAEEKKLLEDGKLAELLTARSAEVEHLKTRIGDFERHDHLAKLLDKHGITDPSQRAVFGNLTGDIAQLDAVIGAFVETRKAEIDRLVAERLKSPAPPQGQQQAPLNLQAQLAEAKSKGDWPTVTRLNNAILDAQTKRMASGIGAVNAASVAAQLRTQ